MSIFSSVNFNFSFRFRAIGCCTACLWFDSYTVQIFVLLTLLLPNLFVYNVCKGTYDIAEIPCVGFISHTKKRNKERKKEIFFKKRINQRTVVYFVIQQHCHVYLKLLGVPVLTGTWKNNSIEQSSLIRFGPWMSFYLVCSSVLTRTTVFVLQRLMAWEWACVT